MTRGHGAESMPYGLRSCTGIAVVDLEADGVGGVEGNRGDRTTLRTVDTAGGAVGQIGDGFDRVGSSTVEGGDAVGVAGNDYLGAGIGQTQVHPWRRIAEVAGDHIAIAAVNRSGQRGRGGIV